MRWLAFVVLVGCWTRQTNTSPPAPKDAALVDTQRHPSPESRARAMIEKQIAIGNNRIDDADVRLAALVDTFVESAIIITRSSHRPDQLGEDQFRHAKIASLRADGTADAVWFVAELEYEGVHDDGQNTPFANNERYAGLIVAESGWRIAAASISSPMMKMAGNGLPRNGLEMHGGTEPGPLTALALDGPALAARVSPSTIVSSPEFPDWAKHNLVLDPNTREVTTSTWGFVQANVRFPGGNPVMFVVAVNDVSGWRPVLIHHVPQ